LVWGKWWYVGEAGSAGWGGVRGRAAEVEGGVVDGERKRKGGGMEGIMGGGGRGSEIGKGAAVTNRNCLN